MCSMPRRTASELSKTPPKRFFKPFNSFSADVLSRFRRRFSSSNSSRASAASALALEPTSSTRSSKLSTLWEARSMKLFTSSRSSEDLSSSAWYSSLTCFTKLALCDATVSEAVRKCSRTSFTTSPTVCRIWEVAVLLSCTILATSARSFSSCTASALPSCNAATASSSFPKVAFVFFSSPATLAKLNSSPHSSSLRALCCRCIVAKRTSASALNWFSLLLCSSTRDSHTSRTASWSSSRRLTSLATRSKLRFR
mmetsp:Transcript_51102/g.81689  ORF Transcript_51102/g.81689 Transcript_51102/m.81689 type:complete len:254 (+) Transcript_51102:670-1431(+)